MRSHNPAGLFAAECRQEGWWVAGEWVAETVVGEGHPVGAGGPMAVEERRPEQPDRPPANEARERPRDSRSADVGEYREKVRVRRFAGQ